MTNLPAEQSSAATLSPGARLGPYEIVGPLGAGGMGEVYRARDPRLRRDVALKVLHRSLDATPERVERLAREARAAGGLNHPNIVAVYDVGTQGDRPYIVSELLEGESLRRRLDRGPLPYRKAVEYGIQIANALGAAHEKGVWHRDVKPGNVIVTTDGRIKLVDFGLVKFSETERPEQGSQDSTAEDTRPGLVLGTVGYMSPEQVLGEPIDHRTDVFALGSMLYEMFAGSPAFRRGTTLETVRAVLSEDPPEILLQNPKLPKAAAAVVRRCLEKNKEQRFQSARDLAFQLEQLQEATDADSQSWQTRAVGRRNLIWWIAAACLVPATAALVIPRLAKPAPGFEQLTFRRARVGGARFVPGSGAVVYSEAREARPLEVFWVSGPDSPEPRVLGHRASDVLAVHGGKLALSMQRRFVFGERFVGTLAEAPLGEGSPRELASNVEEADWDPQGGRMVVVRSPSLSEKTRLEYPPGQVLYETSASLSSPRFSPDGQRIAFFEDTTGRGAGGHVAVVDLRGRKTHLTAQSFKSARGLAWSAAGNEVWFAAGASFASRALRAVDLAKRERVILDVPASLSLWDVASDGRVLLSRDEQRSALVGVAPGDAAEKDLSWFDDSSLADLSEDGRLLLFSDRYGLYIRGTDGSPPIRLGLRDGFGDAISPDGKRVLATSRDGDQQMILPAAAGDPVPLPNQGIATHRGASWFPDGNRIFFSGGPPGSTQRSYVQDLASGQVRELTPENAWATAISPDGKWVAVIGFGEGISLWPVDGGKPRLVPSSQKGDRPIAWSADGRSLWLYRRGEMPAEVFQLDIETGHRRVWRKLQPPDAAGVYSITDFRVTRDGRAYFYSYNRMLSQLYVATGLR